MLQKQHPIIKQITAASDVGQVNFETAEEATKAFNEIAAFYGKTPENTFFCIRALLEKPSANAKNYGIKATIATIRLETNLLTRSGIQHRVTYKKGAGSYKSLFELATKFNVDLT